MSGDHSVGQKRAGGAGNDRPGPTSDLEQRVNTFSRVECGEMQGRRQQTYPAYCSIPPLLFPGSPPGIVGGPDTLPVPGAHSGRGSQLRHTSPETLQSEGR